MREMMYESYLPFAMLFSESIRGLQPGAPVEYRGIRIGTVKKVPLHLSAQNAITTANIPILAHIELERIYDLTATSETEAQLAQSFQQAFKKGLRASLKTGNLLSGALYIDTDFYPDTPETEADQTYFGYPVFPTVEGEFVQFQRQVGNILDKLNKLPLETTLQNLDSTLETTQKTVASFEGVGTELTATLAALDALLKQKETQNLPKEVQGSLQQLQTTLKGFSPGSDSYLDLQQALSQLNGVLAELEPLLKTLNAKPDALIFGAEGKTDPIPVKGGRQ